MQYINFIDQLEAPKKEFIPLVWQLTALTLSVFVPLLAALLVSLWDYDLDRQVASATSAQQQASTTLEAELASARQKTQTQQLEAQIEQFHHDIAAYQQLLDVVDNSQSPSTNIGFAPLLDGLAKHSTGALWLDNIEFLDNGQAMILAGQTRQAQSVLQYLQDLGQEPAFHGHQFRVFRITENIDHPGLMSFLIRSREVEE